MLRYNRVMWGVLWHSCNHLDGPCEHLLNRDHKPVLFCTRREARDYINKYYAYLRSIPDVRREPHGWRMPRPVRVEIRALTDWRGNKL
jgi:hypothetical protein